MKSFKTFNPGPHKFLKIKFALVWDDDNLDTRLDYGFTRQVYYPHLTEDNASKVDAIDTYIDACEEMLAGESKEESNIDVEYEAIERAVYNEILSNAHLTSDMDRRNLYMRVMSHELYGFIEKSGEYSLSFLIPLEVDSTQKKEVAQFIVQLPNMDLTKLKDRFAKRRHEKK